MMIGNVLRNLCLLFLLSVAFVPFSFALELKDFKVEAEEDEFILKIPANKEFRHEMTANLEAPELIEVKPVPKASTDFILLLYRSGSLGTYKHFDVQWAAIINAKTWKVVGEAPWKYTALEKKDVKFVDPKWKFLGAQILVEDEEFDEKNQFKLE